MENTSDFFENIFARLQLSYAVFHFHLVAIEQIFLPEFKGSAFRGGFGNAFKKVCCVNPGLKYCNSCQLNTRCAYAYIFETPQTSSFSANITASNLPHPFVILPPLSRKEMLEPGETLDFSITTIGRGIDFLPYFVYAFDELGRMGLGRGKGKYKLEKVTDSVGTEIFHINHRTLSGNFKKNDINEPINDLVFDKEIQLTLNFLTPTRITDKNKLVKDLSFDLLVRNLLRRCSLLAQVHCQQPWQLDYGAMIEMARKYVSNTASALSWYDWERYSNRQEQRMNLPGFVGPIQFKGIIAPFLPLLLIGQHLHVGKNTSFGMGKYVIVKQEIV